MKSPKSKKWPVHEITVFFSLKKQNMYFIKSVITLFNSHNIIIILVKNSVLCTAVYYYKNDWLMRCYFSCSEARIRAEGFIGSLVCNCLVFRPVLWNTGASVSIRFFRMLNEVCVDRGMDQGWGVLARCWQWRDSAWHATS